jgi:hypothetical protein
MPFSRIAESRIRAAVEQGEFENLPGAGKPLDLEEYFSAPEELRMAFSILKNANCVPAEVELLNEVSRLQRAIASADVEQKQELQRALVHRQTQLALMLERWSSREKSRAHITPKDKSGLEGLSLESRIPNPESRRASVPRNPPSR